MPHILANGIRLYFRERGQGTPILCIHGSGSDAAVWGDAADELGRLGRVITYDRRGSSRSERPDRYEVTSLEEHAEDAAALLDALSATPAIIIGRSYGGAVAVSLALQHSDSVRALVLLEGSAPGVSPDTDAALRPMAERFLKMASQQGLAAATATFYRWALGDSVWESFPKPRQEAFIANGPAIAAEMKGMGLRTEVPDLKPITQPTLCVAAASSPPVFRKAMEISASLLPNGRFVLVEGGHMINPANPEVISFIQGVEGHGTGPRSEPAALRATS